MHKAQPVTKEVYYTTDHEWISYQEGQAYFGICAFKLTGYSKIERIVFSHWDGYLQKGEVIASIHYKDYVVKAHMPVDGVLIQLNPSLVNGLFNVLHQSPEDAGWIAEITPHKITDLQELLSAGSL